MVTRRDSNSFKMVKQTGRIVRDAFWFKNNEGLRGFISDGRSGFSFVYFKVPDKERDLFVQDQEITFDATLKRNCWNDKWDTEIVIEKIYEKDPF